MMYGECVEAFYCVVRARWVVAHRHPAAPMVDLLIHWRST